MATLRRHRQRGFTVIEAVVSTTITLVVLLITAQLVRDAQLAALSGRRQALDPTPQHIAQSLRNDVHGARRIGAEVYRSPGWTYGELDLALPDGGVVRYEKSGEEIRRTLFASSGTTVSRRPLLRDVVSWRWIQLDGGLVELEIIYRRRPANDAVRPTWVNEQPSTETMNLRLASRAIPGRRSW